MNRYLIIIFLFFSPIYASTVSDLTCLKEYNDVTNKSLIRDTSPNTININTKKDLLKKFEWDKQELKMHFEIISDDNFDLKIGSKGYSDINNAVFFEINDSLGYLYQYSKKGVIYSCIQK